MKTMFRKIYFRLLIIKLSLRWIFRVNIGDKVIHQGKRWFINNGVSAPVWDCLTDVPIEDREHKRIHQKNFKKINSIKVMWNNFRQAHSFYMGNWYDIWVRGGIKDWMRGANIWGKDRAKQIKE